MDGADGADHINIAMQESFKAETEFHVRMFERINNDYKEEEVCGGTWIPVWAAAFGEVVHMYEISPVNEGWSGEADQFPRDATLPADQEWYAERFKRAKRETDKASDALQRGTDCQFRNELHMDLVGRGQGTTESSDPPGDITSVRRGVTQRQTPRTQEPSDDERKPRLRALNVGRHLYNMDASMRARTELQNEGMGGGVTERAQEELSRRSTARTQKRQKSRCRCEQRHKCGCGQRS